MRERKHLYANYLTRCSVDLDRIWCAVKTCWYSEHYSHFISSSKCSRERTNLGEERCERFKYWLAFRHLLTDFFQTWYDDRHH